MKVCILGDTHLGARNDDLDFHRYFRLFYDFMFSYLEKEDIGTILQMGDLFDKRKTINFNTLHLAKDYFFDRISKFRYQGIIGNHDIYHRNTLTINSPNLIAPSLCVPQSPGTIIPSDGGLSIDMIPWICKDNHAEVMDFISKSKSKICCGHFELQGFEMDAGQVATYGMTKDFLNKYDMVLSGHYHQRSTDGHIWYVGAPCELTWADAGQSRGFSILDTDTMWLNHIENPFKMFNRVVYDESTKTTIPDITGRYIRVLVQNRTNMKEFDKFMSNIYSQSPSDVSIIEPDVVSDSAVEVDLSQLEDTVTTLNKYVDGLSLSSVDPESIKRTLKLLYTETLSTETE